MRVKRPVRGDLALEPELFRVGRKQQFDRGGVEANAMVQPLDPVFCVDALDGHHGCQDLYFGDAGRVAGEQRLDIERLWRHDHEIYTVARNVYPRQPVHHLIDLSNDDASLESRRFDDGRRILRVRTHVEIALAVGAASYRQRDMRRKVDDVAGEQFDIGVDRAELDLSRIQGPRHCGALRPRIGIVEPPCDPFLEQVDVLGQHNPGLHDVKVVQHFWIGLGQAGRQEVRLLLVVAFEADTISGPDHRFKQRGRVVGRHHLPLGEFTACVETFIAGSPLALPISHIVQVPLMLFCQASAPCASLLLHDRAQMRCTPYTQRVLDRAPMLIACVSPRPNNRINSLDCSRASAGIAEIGCDGIG